LLLELKASSR